MKLYGLFGKGSGKLGSSVFAISSGEQIVREYNPVVENPNTPAQVEQRAKFKLLSQLATDMAKALAFKKEGLVSARNKFIAFNMKAVAYKAPTASVNLTALSVTGGSRYFGAVNITRKEGNTGFNFTFQRVNYANIKSIVVAAFIRQEENRLRFHDSVVFTKNNDVFVPEREMDNSTDDLVFFAYGIIPSGESANINYKGYLVNADERSVALSYASAMITSGAIVTETTVELVAGTGE